MSVVIPAYNAEKTIEHALKSIFDQQFAANEIIAVNDGSTDSTFNILDAYRARVVTLRQPNRGPAAARNAGAKVATGEYLAFLDADDVWLPGKLHACVEQLDVSPAAVAVYSDVLCVDGRIISSIPRSSSLHDLLNCESALYPSAAVVRRRAFEQCGGFSEEFRKGDFGEDTFFGLRLRELGELIHIAKPLVIYHGPEASQALFKYPKGYRTFVRLVKKRYGTRANGVILNARRYYASLLTAVALKQIKRNPLSPIALSNLLKATTVCPSYVVQAVFRSKQWRRRVRPTTSGNNAHQHSRTGYSDTSY